MMFSSFDREEASRKYWLVLNFLLSILNDAEKVISVDFEKC
jgi:hypothetical protein